VSATTPTIRGRFGAVSATDSFATRAGMDILEAGGNAFDAAVAAGFVMQVVEPHLSGPAGEVVVVFCAHDEPGPRVLCGQGCAPAAATPALFEKLGLGLVPGTGVLSAPVPGAFGAWLTLLRDYGGKSLREVLSPAIGYAENGFPLLFPTAFQIAMLQETLWEDWPSSAAVYLPGGRVPDAGDVFRNIALGNTYSRLLAVSESAGGSRDHQINAAIQAWYQGFVADEIEAFSQRLHRDPNSGTAAGVITGSDLAGWEASYEAPATLNWEGYTVAKAGAWSQGPVFLQQLALLAGFNDVLRGPRSAEYVHVTVEAAKLAYADREAFYGDVPDAPIQALLSDDYTRERRGLIRSSASWSVQPGAPGGRPPRLPKLMPASPERMPDVEAAMRKATRGRVQGPSGDTCHVATTDRWGNMVAATPSGGFLTKSPVIEALGFPLSTRLEMTWLEPGLPNTLAAGKRPRTTLSPTIVTRDGRPVMAFGTPGADQQEQWSLLFLLAVTAGTEPQAAMHLPTWHTNHLASSLCPHRTKLGQVEIEASVGESVIAGLQQRGHQVVVRKAGSLSRLCAVGRGVATGEVWAAADPRHGQARAYGR